MAMEGGLEQAREGLEQSLNAPEKEQPVQETQKDLELDSIEKFKWEGKDWTLKDLKEAVMLKSDYTRKRQEEAAERDWASNYKKYVSALQHDLTALSQNPNLIAEFKKIYPQEFHSIETLLARQEQAVQQSQSNTQSAIDPELRKTLDELKSFKDDQEKRVFESEVKAAEAEIDGVFKAYSSKYPLADEEAVIARAQAWLESNKGQTLNQKLWEDIFKTVHDKGVKLYEQHYKGQVEKQKTAHKVGADVPAGGGIPGQAPKKMSMKEAKEAMLNSIRGA